MSWPRASVRLEFLGAFEFIEVTVEGAVGEVTGFTGELKHEAVGEGDGGAGAVEVEGGSDGGGVLDDEVAVVEEHFDGFCEVCGREVIDGGEDPGSFGKSERGDPGAGRYEGFGVGGLAGVVAGD